ncbi:MAG: ABC transporter substrate-binding protein [Oscillospiraceae bacterium]
MKKGISILAAASLLFSLAACGGAASSSAAASAPAASGSASASTESVRIGVISPNTGNLAAYGEAVTNGIKLAIEEINAAGGVLGGRSLEVVDYLDDKGDSSEGANAFNKLTSEGVSAIIGSVTSGVTAGLATLADEQGMLLLTPTATADTVTEGFPSVFRACFRDSYQGEMVAKFAAEELGVTKVGVLYASGDAYSAGLYEAFKNAAETYGLEIVGTESSSSTDDTDFNAQLTNLASSGAELIFAPYYYSAVGPYIVPQARAAGFEGYLIGADGWDGTIGTMVEDKTLYNDTFFTNHYAADDPSEKVQAFVTAYSDEFGADSLNALAALAYDSVYMLAQAIDAAGSDATADIVTAMTGMSFEGVTGSFTLDDTNTPAKSVAIIEFKDGAALWNSTIGGNA